MWRAGHAAWPMGQGSARPRSSEYRGCGVRQQAGPDRLGGAAARRKVCCQGHALGGVAVGRSELEGAGRSMRFASGYRDGLTVERRFGSLVKIAALDAECFMRTGARVSPSWPGDTSEAGYVEAD